MGVPKFFRYISERYPCLSELVKEYQLPEFDNLYLDMNGIIHMCSHPDDNNPHFRITEEKIFKDVFHYIEVLFRMIRPQKLFFMAVDGVAPRAKMNQQRGRRFRSAKDAEKSESEAKKKGEVLPDAERFDSNCITPGTPFMARLQEQLKYFVVEKISNDPLWQKCKVILSGHETPGEGEHKIMDYIRYIRAQPGYDPNTRHCLYGLDADLIMLGLCTHEPHFSLLREEVKFGRKSTKRNSVPEEITYFLLHLSLMREYLELEFTPLRGNLKGFEYDFEKIIDDWVLMGFLVGNDFIPHLPNLHIANGALPILYKAYMDILPTLDGYINEGGTLHLGRFEKFMEKLGSIDVENFEEIRDDLLYMEAKTGRKWKADANEKPRDLQEWNSDEVPAFPAESLEPEKRMNSDLAALIKEADDMCIGGSSEESCDSDEDEAFDSFKKDYYRDKMGYMKVTPAVMRDQAEGYVRAIQWNLNYYYNGVCSWSWYYPGHYAPYISDIKGFTDLKIEFELGTPFKPYEQLLAVLPSASKNLLPEVYHKLMTDEESIIKQYYPEEFQTDLNGKKQEWEAVVLVPFIDENLLLEAMKSCNEKLSPDEQRRNSHGPMVVCTYSSENLGIYSAPEYFPAVAENHAVITTLSNEDIRVPREKLIKGAYPGVKMNVYYPGFPTMKHLKYKGELRKAKIKVFETPSRNENMIVTIIPDELLAGDLIPVDLLGTSVFVGWPHLVEAKVVAISNSKRKYVSKGEPGEYDCEERTGNLIAQFQKEIQGITEYFKNRMGIECGNTSVLVYVKPMIGRRYVFSPQGRLTLEKQFAELTSNYPMQTVVFNISSYDSHHSAFSDVESVFPEGCDCFTLTNPYYGSQGTVLDSKESLKNGRVKICISVSEEPDFSPLKDLEDIIRRSYKSLFNAASQLSLPNYIFSRITGSIFITARNNEGGFKNVAAGLDLKFNKKNRETPGYTRKSGGTWYYTDKSVELVRSYIESFPEIFQFLSTNNKFEDINAEDIFGEDCDEKVKSLQDFLRKVPTHNVERQTCGSSVIELEIVQEIEKIVDSFPKNQNAKKVTMQIKPSFLYRPELQCGTLLPDGKVDVKILDRIVNVRNGFSVPFGLKGTVIGIQEANTGSDRDTMYDILFDSAFKDGMTLNCTPERGYRLPKTAFINISYGKRIMEEKTGKPAELMAKADNWRNNSQQPNQQQHYSKQQPPFRQQNSAFASFNNMAGPKYPFPGQQQNAPVVQQPNQGFYNAGQKQMYHQQRQQAPPPQTNSDFNPAEYRSNFQRTSGNSFMPQFGGKQGSNEAGTGSPQKTQSSNQQTKVVSQPESPHHHQVQSVDTELLKNMLKIGSYSATENKENVKTEKFPSSEPSTSSPSTKPKEIQSQNLSFEMFAQAAKAPASVRLLTYYQSNGLGLPRYQYFNAGDLIQAQITLHSGEIIIGKAAKLREEASENVAKDVLEIFLKTAKTEGPNNYSTPELPVPPQIWVQPQQSKSANKNYSRNNGQPQQQQQQQRNQNTRYFSNSNNPPNTGNKRLGKASALNNSFVPLQAIKKHITKQDSNMKKEDSDNSLKNQAAQENVKEMKSPDSMNKTDVKQDEGASASVSKDNPKRERKTRIAANFIKKT